MENPSTVYLLSRANYCKLPVFRGLPMWRNTLYLMLWSSGHLFYPVGPKMYLYILQYNPYKFLSQSCHITFCALSRSTFPLQEDDSLCLTLEQSHWRRLHVSPPVVNWLHNVMEKYKCNCQLQWKCEWIIAIKTQTEDTDTCRVMQAYPLFTHHILHMESSPSIYLKKGLSYPGTMASWSFWQKNFNL